MGGLQTVFGWLGASRGSRELPDIFPFPILQKDFITIDVQNIYTRILTAVLERTDGVTDEQQALLWDNCIANESTDGLVTLIAKAMAEKKDLFIVYDKGLKLIRKATSTEQGTIEADYKARGESKAGVFITFRNYTKTDMVKIYSGLDYLTVGSLHKSMNLSKAVQIKISDLRASVALTDKAQAEGQAGLIADGLKSGRDVALDAKDIIETAKPDLTATNSSIEFIAKKLSFYLGLPASWITGESAKGLGDSGQGEAKAIERGLKTYYFSVVKPVLEAIFGIKTSFKSEDFMLISTALEAMKTFEITSDELVSQDNKRQITNKLLGLPPDSKGDPPAKTETPPATNQPPAVPPANPRPAV